MVIELTLICSSSRTFPSSATSRIDETEVVARVGFAGTGRTAPEDRARGALEGVVAGRLCLELRGARLTPSETDARGREAEEAIELAGDTTDARVAPAPAGGLAGAEADVVVLTGGFEVDGGGGFGGRTERRRLGGATEGAGARAEAIDGLDGEDGELVDFLSRGAVVEAFAVGGFADDDFTVPAPNVPELMI
jgi:hypothetical protein